MVRRALQAINPATGKLLGEVWIDEADQVREKVRLAREGWRLWRETSFKERGQLLRSLQQQVLEEMEDIVSTISEETGKPRFEALAAEVVPVLDSISYWIKRTPRVLSPKKIKLHFLKIKKSTLVYSPLGVVGMISPWNYPFGVPMSDMILALIAGNCVILKPSEYTPLVGKKIEMLFEKAGFPPGVCSCIYGAGDIGAALIASGVDKIFFTGGTKTGKKVMASAAEQLTPVVLELGGKDPMIVCSDADLDLAVEGALWGGLCNAGQTCAGVERIYVTKDVAEPFMEKLLRRVSEIRVGDPKTNEIDVGSLTTEAQLQVVEEHLADAVAKGGKIVYGGKKIGNLFFEPTILAGADHQMRIMREETFGPVLAIEEIENEEEAIQKANDCELGLCASVWTKNISRGRKLGAQIDAGTITVNDCSYTHALCETPWGGMKKSGIGRVHSDEGLKEFVVQKHINYPATPFFGQALWWFPYSKEKYHFFSILGRLFAAERLYEKVALGFRLMFAFWKMRGGRKRV